MSTDDIIMAWKDPDHRGDDSGAEHPAGRIELFGTNTADDPAAGTPATVIIGLTIAASELICGSMARGSCGAWTVGCCY